MKFAFRSESCKRNFSTIPFVYNLMIGCPNKNKGNYLKKALKKVNEETTTTTGPQSFWLLNKLLLRKCVGNRMENMLTDVRV